MAKPWFARPAVVRRVIPMKTLIAVLALALASVAVLPSSQAALQVPEEPSFPTCAPAAVGTVCFSPYWPGCNLWVVWTAIPLPPSCLYRTDGLAMDGSLAVGDALPSLDCMDVYKQDHLVGQYWLVRRDTCSAELYECPDGYAPPTEPCRKVNLLELESAAAAAPPSVPDLPPIECAAIYNRIDLGPAAVVMTSGCSGHVEVCGDRVPMSVVLPDLSCLALAQPPLNCLPYYNEHEVGPVTIVQGGCGNDVRVCDTSVLREMVVDLSCLLTMTPADAAGANGS